MYILLGVPSVTYSKLFGNSWPGQEVQSMTRECYIYTGWNSLIHVGFWLNNFDLIKAGAVHTCRSFWTGLFLSPFILYLIILKAVMSYFGHTNNSWKSHKIYNLPLSPNKHKQTQKLYMVRGKKTPNSITLKEAYILHLAHMLLIFTDSHQEKKLCIVSLWKQSDAIKREIKVKLDLWKQSNSPYH